MPVVETCPPGEASPNAPVSWSKVPQLTPPSARAVIRTGSTRTLRIGDRSSTSPSSHVEWPGTLWPPPRTDSSIPFSRA